MKKPLILTGGKNAIIKTILENIPPHHVYVEPYFGGGTVFFAKEPSEIEIINDIDDRLVTFYRVLQDEQKAKKLYRMILYTLYSDAEMRRAGEILMNKDKHSDLEVAYAVFVNINSNIRHELNPRCKNVALDYTKKGQSLTKVGKERILFAIERIKDAIILNRDAIQIIEQSDRPEVFMFLDPPYLNTSKFYTYDCDLDYHQRLLETLKNLKHAKFMITTFKNELYDKELAECRRIEIERTCFVKCLPRRTVLKDATDKTRRDKRTEVIYMNYDLTK